MRRAAVCVACCQRRRSPRLRQGRASSATRAAWAHIKDHWRAACCRRSSLARLVRSCGERHSRRPGCALARRPGRATHAGARLLLLQRYSLRTDAARPQASAWLVVIARRDAAALATLEALLQGAASRDALRVLWVHPDAAAIDDAFERAAVASTLTATLPLSALCHEPPFATAPAPLQAVFDADAAAAPNGSAAATAVHVGVQGASQHCLGCVSFVALGGAPPHQHQQHDIDLTCAAVVPLAAVPAALLECNIGSTLAPLHGAPGLAGLDAAAHALGECAAVALVHSAGGAGAAPAWGLLLPTPPGTSTLVLKWLRAPPPSAGGARARTFMTAGGARSMPGATPRGPHSRGLWAAATAARVGAGVLPRNAPAEHELASALRAADARVRPPTPTAAEATATAELVCRLRARSEGPAAADASPPSLRRRALPRTPAGAAAASDLAAHAPTGPSAPSVDGAAGALNAAVAAAAAAVAQYVRTPSSDAVPVGEFAAEVVARALRAASASPTAGAPAAWRQALIAALLLGPAALAARHPAGCEPRAKRREYTLQALLHLWLSLEPRADADRADEVPSRARAAAAQAASLLAHCALLLEPMGADGLTLFCDTHVAPALAAAAPVTTRRLHAALGIGAPGEANRRDRGCAGEALTPLSLSHGLHALHDPPAEGHANAPDVAKSRRPAPRMPRGGGVEPAASRGRGGASLRLRRVVPGVAAARPVPTLRPAPAAGASERRRAAPAASPPPPPRVRRAVALASPPVAASSGGSDDDGDDAVVPCTTLRRGARGAEGRSPRRSSFRSPRRARALALFAADSPPPPQSMQSPRDGGDAAAAFASPPVLLPAAAEVGACARCSGLCLCALPQSSPPDAAPRSRRRSGSRAAPPSGSAGRKRTRASDADAVSPRRTMRARLP